MTLRRKRSGRRSQKDSAVWINHNYGRFTEMNNIRSADAKVICRKEFKYLLRSVCHKENVVKCTVCIPIIQFQVRLPNCMAWEM